MAQWQALAAAISVVSMGLLVTGSTVSVATQEFDPGYPKAILEEIGLGLLPDDCEVFGFDLRDAEVRKSVAYEFRVEMGNVTLLLKVLKAVNRWNYVDLPILQMEYCDKLDNLNPVLDPFQLAGPMDLWIEDAMDVRISLPHDVDVGELKKVVLADGAVITVIGARSVSLCHPIELPLPLNQTDSTGFASSMLTLATHLREAACTQDSPLLSLRIVGLTSLMPPSSSSSSSLSNQLKLKQLALGVVKLSSAQKKRGEPTALLEPNSIATFWPAVSISGSNSYLLYFEDMLISVLGSKADKKGSFKLLKVDVSTQTYVKLSFGVRIEPKEGDPERKLPAWVTTPDYVRKYFDLWATVDGDKLVPETVVEADPLMADDSISLEALLESIGLSIDANIRRHPSPFTL